MPWWLREQRLPKFNSKDFMSDEMKMEKELVWYSVYKRNWIAFNQIEIQMDVYDNWVTIAVREGNGSFWDNSSGIIYELQRSCRPN